MATETHAAVVTAPGVALTPDQSRRALALEAVLVLIAGRSVQMHTVWELARWIETGEVAP